MPTRQADIRPQKFAHVVLRTTRLDEMRRWWKTVLQLESAFENDYAGFYSYDDEHHRVAIFAIPGLQEGTAKAAGVDHVAYGYASLEALLDTYQRLEAGGITPYWSINHGPTTSFYYRDPDGNQVELFIDHWDDVEKLNAWFSTESFRQNPIGVEFDAKVLLERFQRGDPYEELIKQGSAPPRT